MRRESLVPRPDWVARVEALGFTYHTHDNGPYWDESACYVLSSAEVDELEAAGNVLHALYLEAARQVIARGWFERLGIPAKAVPAVVASWERDDPSVYGRFDIAYDGRQPPKLLEYNADTPTSLVEAAVVQWYWMKERFPQADQFNSIHERLIEAWRAVGSAKVHFTSTGELPEDEQTVAYLMDTCQQAGFSPQWLAIGDVGWDEQARCFADLKGGRIDALFKLYPWEWLWGEPFSAELTKASGLFIEPPWKLLYQSKGMLPVLWELFPGHPNLLAAFDEPMRLNGSYARKPRFSREGANVTLVERGFTLEENHGDYADQGFIYQALAPIPDFGGQRPVMGLWMANNEACGLGIREDTRRITGNFSRFVPHRME